MQVQITTRYTVRNKTIMKLLHSPLCTLYLLSVLNESCMHVIFITSFITLDIARSTIRWRCRHGSRTRRARETRGGGLIESGRRSCGRLPSIIKMAQVSLCHSTAPQHLPFPASQSACSGCCATRRDAAPGSPSSLDDLTRERTPAVRMPLSHARRPRCDGHSKESPTRVTRP